MCEINGGDFIPHKLMKDQENIISEVCAKICQQWSQNMKPAIAVYINYVRLFGTKN